MSWNSRQNKDSLLQADWAVDSDCLYQWHFGKNYSLPFPGPEHNCVLARKRTINQNAFGLSAYYESDDQVITWNIYHCCWQERKRHVLPLGTFLNAKELWKKYGKGDSKLSLLQPEAFFLCTACLTQKIQKQKQKKHISSETAVLFPGFLRQSAKCESCHRTPVQISCMIPFHGSVWNHGKHAIKREQNDHTAALSAVMVAIARWNHAKEF